MENTKELKRWFDGVCVDHWSCMFCVSSRLWLCVFMRIGELLGNLLYNEQFFFFLEQFILLRIFFWVFKCELKWSLKPLLIANLWWKAAYDQLTQTRAWYLNLVECGVNYFSAIDSVFFLFIIFFIYLFIFCLKNIFIFLCKLVFSNTYLHLRMLDSALVVELKDHHVARMLLNVT